MVLEDDFRSEVTRRKGFFKLQLNIFRTDRVDSSHWWQSCKNSWSVGLWVCMTPLYGYDTSLFDMVSYLWQPSWMGLSPNSKQLASSSFLLFRHNTWSIKKQKTRRTQVIMYLVPSNDYFLTLLLLTLAVMTNSLIDAFCSKKGVMPDDLRWHINCCFCPLTS